MSNSATANAEIVENLDRILRIGRKYNQQRRLNETDTKADHHPKTSEIDTTTKYTGPEEN